MITIMFFFIFPSVNWPKKVWFFRNLAKYGQKLCKMWPKIMLNMGKSRFMTLWSKSSLVQSLVIWPQTVSAPLPLIDVYLLILIPSITYSIYTITHIYTFHFLNKQLQPFVHSSLLVFLWLELVFFLTLFCWCTSRFMQAAHENAMNW